MIRVIPKMDLGVGEKGFIYPTKKETHHYDFPINSTLDKQRICVNTQQKSSKKQLKLSVCVPKSNSNNRYAITCDVIAYHLVHFFSIRLINKCLSGIDFIFSSERAIYSTFMKISVPSQVFRGKTK